MTTFNSDLAFGQRFEHELLDWLPNHENAHFPEAGLHSGFDLTIDGLTYEVKSDRRANKTGNLCIEHRNGVCASGINVTTADYWALFVIVNNEADRLYIIPTNELKQMIRKYKPRSVFGGDYKKSQMYLMPENLFSQYRVTHP